MFGSFWKACMAALFFVVIMAVSTISFGQNTVTAAQWQADLKWLQNTVHEKYSNLFYNVTARQFDSAVAAFHEQIPTLSDMDIKVGFVRLVAAFKIGHTGVRFRSGEGDQLFDLFRQIPVTFYQFSDGLYIRNIHWKYKEALGGKVVSIGSTPIHEALEKMHAVIPEENAQYFDNNLQYFLRIPELLQAQKVISSSDVVVVNYLKDGKEKSIEITGEPVKQIFTHSQIDVPNDWVDASAGTSPLWMKYPERLHHFEYIPATKTLYVRHSGVQNDANETLEAFFGRVFHFADSVSADKLVLDIRLNGGGNNYLNKPVITGVIQNKKINRYGHFFVIIGKATFSAAQNLTNELEKYTAAIFVGEPTAENVNFYGDTRSEILPISKLNVRLSFLWWQNMDPRDTRKATSPYMAASMSYDNYRSGFDSAMSLITTFKEQKPVEERIKDLVNLGKYNEALQAAKAYLSNHTYRYFVGQLEGNLNTVGYTLMNENKFNEASKVLGINVQLFPTSANAYDSYAESLWKLGKKEEALKNYQKAIAIDPDGPVGENSKKMIVQVGKS